MIIYKPNKFKLIPINLLNILIMIVITYILIIEYFNEYLLILLVVWILIIYSITALFLMKISLNRDGLYYNFKFKIFNFFSRGITWEEITSVKYLNRKIILINNSGFKLTINSGWKNYKMLHIDIYKYIKTYNPNVKIDQTTIDYMNKLGITE
ncbi:hypothetical protein KHQ81_06320 [Mycoplasmatota bacterium]|nr:hypothetical protein KHQ81_06320 [Mycoplasmatota bacterium]